MLQYLQRYKYKLLAISIGITYLWFGFLKYFPGISPAEILAKDTITILTFRLIPSDISIILLAVWETVVGFWLIFLPIKRFVVIAALIHIILTFTPFLFFPDQSFNHNVFSLTLVGQYIIKNLIIICGLIILYPTDEKAESRP